jgi:hypothetical protein
MGRSGLDAARAKQSGRGLPMSCSALDVIASGAKQSMARQKMDCFVAFAPRKDDLDRHCERSEAIHGAAKMDCFVAFAPRKDDLDRHCGRSEAIHDAAKMDCFVAFAPRKDGKRLALR